MNAPKTILMCVITLVAAWTLSCSDDAPAGLSDDAANTNDTGSPDLGDDPTASLQLEIAGLSAPAVVRIDPYGIVHASCSTDNDCFAVQGYYHAAHRFFQMDMRRRVARGRLSTLLKAPDDRTLARDIATRLRMTTRNGEPLEHFAVERMDETTRSALEAYANGVNAFLHDARDGERGARFSEEYDAPFVDARSIPDWTIEDSAAVGLHMLSELVDTGGDDTRAGLLRTRLPQDLFTDLHSAWHVDPDSTVVDASGADYPRPTLDPASLPSPSMPASELETFYERASSALEAASDVYDASSPLFATVGSGSNTWATAPSKNTTDRAILSNTLHTPMTNPSMWYLIGLDSTSWGRGSFHAAGASYAGYPGVMAGYNENIAWGATNAHLDLTDIYVEQLSDDGKSVRFRGAEVEFVERTYKFQTSTGAHKEDFAWVPHHGPVLAIDKEAGVAVTMKSVLQETTSDLGLLIDIGRMRTVDEARRHLSAARAGGLSMMLIGRSGHIGYFPYATVPKRTWDTVGVPPTAPLPGDGDFEWSKQHMSIDELPGLVDPPNGFIATADAGLTRDMLDGLPGNAGHPPLQTLRIAPGLRQGRLVDLLAMTTVRQSLQSHMAMQVNNYSLLARHLVPEILGSIPKNELDRWAVQVRDMLLGWNYTCIAGVEPQSYDYYDAHTAARTAAGCSAFQVYLSVLTDMVLGDELAGALDETAHLDKTRLMYVLINSPERLAGEQRYWDDIDTPGLETREDIAKRALTRTGLILYDQTGWGSGEHWEWGRIHTTQLRSPLLSELTHDFDNGPYATAGGRASLNFAPPGDAVGGPDSFEHDIGPTLRLVVEASSGGVFGRVQLAGGQIHHPESPHYDDLLHRWLADEFVHLPFTHEEVADATREIVLVLRPGDGRSN